MVGFALLGGPPLPLHKQDLSGSRLSSLLAIEHERLFHPAAVADRPGPPCEEAPWFTQFMIAAGYLSS
jgi:hypothetical protein